MEITIALIEDIEHNLRLRWTQNVSLNIDPVELSFNYYVRWEAMGFEDLRLGGFLMTNQQMSWFTLAHKSSSKYHIGNNQKIHRSQSEFLHLWFKSREAFRTSFQCDDLTATENFLLFYKPSNKPKINWIKKLDTDFDHLMDGFLMNDEWRTFDD